jgi:hypothetical protein
MMQQGHQQQEPTEATQEVARVTSERRRNPPTLGGGGCQDDDVLEDTSVSLELLREIFGDDVATLVSEVTDVSTAADGNRAARKALDLAHIAQASARGKTIKLADIISNAKSIAQHDPGFAEVYIPEMRAMLEVLQDGDKTLLGRATADVVAVSVLSNANTKITLRLGSASRTSFV